MFGIISLCSCRFVSCSSRCVWINWGSFRVVSRVVLFRCWFVSFRIVTCRCKATTFYVCLNKSYVLKTNRTWNANDAIIRTPARSSSACVCAICGRCCQHENACSVWFVISARFVLVFRCRVRSVFFVVFRLRARFVFGSVFVYRFVFHQTGLNK